MVSLESLKQADCVVLIGSNAPANHPRLVNELIKLRDSGGKVIIINPTVEVGLVKFSSPAYPIKSMLAGGSDISSLYLQPIPGSDVALFVGIQKSLIEQGLIKQDFLQAHTEDWENIIKHAENTPCEVITSTCGISQNEIAIAIDTGSKLIPVIHFSRLMVQNSTTATDKINRDVFLSTQNKSITFPVSGDQDIRYDPIACFRPLHGVC
jgi:anaerobic selenocysteine-containing dehydrogenase